MKSLLGLAVVLAPVVAQDIFSAVPACAVSQTIAGPALARLPAAYLSIWCTWAASSLGIS